MGRAAILDLHEFPGELDRRSQRQDNPRFRKNEGEALRALGGVPVGMPITEVAEAITRGTIGGLATQLSPLTDFGLDRVTNNHFFIRLETVAVAIS